MINFKLWLVLSLSFLMVGAGSAFALPTPDSSSLLTNSAPFGAMQVNQQTCASDGNNPDNDGVCNNWKDQSQHNGLHISFINSAYGTAINYTYNLSCDVTAVYANPNSTQHVDPTGINVCPGIGNKDIYLELDWMHNQTINPQAISDVVTAFYKHGIHLHVQYGEDGVSSGDILKNFCNVDPTGSQNMGTGGQACTNPPNENNDQIFSNLKKAFFGTTSERNPGSSGSFTCPNNGIPSGTYQGNNYAANCLTAKMQVFHYALAAIFQAGHPTYSGWSEILGNDFLITLGNFQNNGAGNIDEQEAAIMHELGHNLGLNHGGKMTDSNNCKPNYLSVMNYIYQFRENADSCRPLDYSNVTLAALPQSYLSDSNVGSDQYPSDNPPQGPDGQTAPGGASCPNSGERPIWWSHGSRIPQSTTGVTDDWNQGLPKSDYAQILNNVASSCNAVTTSPYVTLNGNNDWSCIINGGCGSVYPPMNFRQSSGFVGSVPQAGQDPDLMGNLTTDQQFVMYQNQTNPTVPGAPTGLTASGGNAQISLSWTAPSSDGGSPITSYNIYRGMASGAEGTTPVATGVTSTAYTDTGLGNGVTYYYKVTALNSVGESPQSNESNATTSGDQLASMAWAAGLAVAGVMSGIGVWTAVRRR